jgi:hypothetical protein
MMQSVGGLQEIDVGVKRTDLQSRIEFSKLPRAQCRRARLPIHRHLPVALVLKGYTAIREKMQAIKNPAEHRGAATGPEQRRGQMFTWGGLIKIRQLPSINRRKELSE